MVDRLIAWMFYGAAYTFGIAAGLIVLVGFIDWLQTGQWSGVNLLEFGYDTNVIKARWFLENQWSWWLHDVLYRIPLFVVLLTCAPLIWLLAVRFERR